MLHTCKERTIFFNIFGIKKKLGFEVKNRLQKKLNWSGHSYLQRNVEDVEVLEPKIGYPDNHQNIKNYRYLIIMYIIVHAYSALYWYDTKICFQQNQFLLFSLLLKPVLWHIQDRQLKIKFKINPTGVFCTYKKFVWTFRYEPPSIGR